MPKNKEQKDRLKEQWEETKQEENEDAKLRREMGFRRTNEPGKNEREIESNGEKQRTEGWLKRAVGKDEGRRKLGKTQKEREEIWSTGEKEEEGTKSGGEQQKIQEEGIVVRQGGRKMKKAKTGGSEYGKIKKKKEAKLSTRV